MLLDRDADADGIYEENEYLLDMNLKVRSRAFYRGGGYFPLIEPERAYLSGQDLQNALKTTLLSIGSVEETLSGEADSWNVEFVDPSIVNKICAIANGTAPGNHLTQSDYDELVNLGGSIKEFFKNNTLESNERLGVYRGITTDTYLFYVENE